MSHPASCQNPEQCDLSYREHLLHIQISPQALPTRSVTHNEHVHDEPTDQTRAREKRMKKDMPAFKALREQGYHPRSVRGAHKLAMTATSAAQIEGRPE